MTHSDYSNYLLLCHFNCYLDGESKPFHHTKGKLSTI